MLEEFKLTLNPASLLEVVPPGILERLMQGFFYGQRAGMVLIYDAGADADGNPILERLEPVRADAANWRSHTENFNPFCAKFRERPDRDAQCEACDLRRAKQVYSGKTDGARYKCHMGLIDMTVPVLVNGKVRGVLYGGQRVLNDQKVLDFIRQQVHNKAPEIEAELESALLESRQTEQQISTFETSFCKFVDAVQATVGAFIKARQEETEREALLEVSEEIGRAQADDAVVWELSTANLFEELESLIGGYPVWLLLRRGSRYECLSASPKAGRFKDVVIPVSSLYSTSLEKVDYLQTGAPLYRELAQPLGLLGQRITLVRADTPISRTEVASVILVLGTSPEPNLDQFLIGCARALAYPAGVMLLFRRLEKQQREFERQASFTGHHLKTPLQAARFDIEEANLITGGDPGSVAERQQLLKDADEQLMQGLADALRLQASAPLSSKEKLNLLKLIEDLIADFSSLARRRSNLIRIVARPTFDCTVYGVPFHLRIAFTNLLDNALKYSYENKTVDVRFSLVPSSGIGVKKVRNFVAIEIENYGVGFPQEQKDDLFLIGTRLYGPSKSHPRSGEGIGLSQAKNYLEAAGGSLDISSVVISAKSELSGGISKVIAISHLPLA